MAKNTEDTITTEEEIVNDDISLEEMFEKIEGIIDALEDPDIAIEDAFGRYEFGMRLLKDCNDRLDTIEKKVLAVGADGELYEF